MAGRPKKVMMITGGASGIGAALARLAAASGTDVAIADVDITGARALADEIGPESAVAVRLDVRSPDLWRAAIDAVQERWGRLDVLVNNAAIVRTGYARHVSREDHQAMVDTNFMGPVTGMLEALARFKAQGHGQIVTVCSTTSFLPFPGLATYAAAKHALRAFHHAVALEERDSPVAFTIVHPSATETPMLEQEAQDDETALAFAGPAMHAPEVAALIFKAIRSKSVEVVIPAARGSVLRRVGTSPTLLRKLVEEREEIGRRRLGERRAAGRSDAAA